MALARCMIVDGDGEARKWTADCIRRTGSAVLVAESEAAIPAARELHRTHVDLLFVDMDLPDMPGNEWLGTLGEAPEVILTGIKRDDALLAFEADALDYLLKPFDFKRLLKALNRFHERQGTKRSLPGSPLVIPEDAFVYLEEGSRTHKIPVKEICFVEVVNDRLRIQTDMLPLEVKNTFDRVEEVLAPWPFLRIQRELLVSIPKIRAFSPSTIELPQASFNVARNYQEQVYSVLRA